MAFPRDRITQQIEIATGGTDGSPVLWEWEDVTDRLDGGQTLYYRRGRGDEASQPQPATLPLVLSNLDGALTPDDPRSPYWPNFTQGTPIRVTTGGADNALFCRGGGGTVSYTPHSNDFNVAGAVDVRLRLAPDAWHYAHPAQQYQPLAGLFSSSSEGQRSWSFALLGPGRPTCLMSDNGTDLDIRSSPRYRMAALRPVNLGMTYEPSTDDATTRTIRWWRNDDDIPPADILEWDLMDEEVIPSPRFVWANGTAELMVGDFGADSPLNFRGRIYWMQYRDGVNGPLLASPNWAAQEPGTTEFDDAQGRTWTVGDTAEISDRKTLAVHSIDDITPIWPHGDNEGGNPDKPSEAVVRLTTAGSLRRLQQGEDPLQSPLRRFFSLPLTQSSLQAYLPMEEAQGADRFGTPLPGGASAEVNEFVALGQDDSLVASSPLPSIQGGKTGTWYGSIDGTEEDKWNASIFWLLPTPDAVEWTELFYIETLGTVRKWVVDLRLNQRRVTAYDTAGNIIDQSTFGMGEVNYAHWHTMRLEMEQVGGAIDWQTRHTSIETGAGFASGEQWAGNLGRPIGAGVECTPPGDGISFGHFTIDDGTRGVEWTAGSDTAWVGETASHRLLRLCNEERIDIEVFGDERGHTAFRGIPGLSAAMGPQRQVTLTALLNECAATDLGVLMERPTAPGFLYRTRKTIEGQTPLVVLDAGASEIANPFEPKKDDQGRANDVTVSAVAGASARVVDEDSIAKGRYKTERKINGVGGVRIQQAIQNVSDGLSVEIERQNLDYANWFLLQGTWPGMRYPEVTINMATAARVLPLWRYVAVGDRIQIRNLPEQHPASTVDLIIQAIADPITPTEWVPSITCSPGGPWAIPQLAAESTSAEGEEPRLISGETVTTEAIDATQLTIPISATDWTEDGVEFPLDVLVEGEAITVSGISSTGGLEQLDVSARSVNGVVRSHPSGVTVEVRDPHRLALGSGEYTNPVIYTPTGNDAIPVILATDFSDVDVFDGSWRIYDGAPGTVNGNNGWGARRASQVSIEDHPTEGKVLTIVGEMGTGADAGLLLHSGAKPGSAAEQQYAHRYGVIKIRARVDDDPDEGTSGLALMWQADTPTVKGPEINIFENFRNRDTRDPVDSFIHWGTNGEFVRGPIAHVGAKTSDWHDYTMVWEPGLVTIQVDDRSPEVLSTSPTEVPQEYMELVFQLDAWSPPGTTDQPTLSGPVKLEISSFSIQSNDVMP